MKKNVNRALGVGWVGLWGLLMAGCAARPLVPSASGSAVGRTVPGGEGALAESPPAGELERYLLILREAHRGMATHQWQRLEESEFALVIEPPPPRAQGSGDPIVPVIAPTRDCHAEYVECFEKCMSRPLAPGFGHMTGRGRGKGAKKEFCNGECLQPYNDCEELQRHKPREFSTTERAVGWLKDNSQAILVGSVFVIAGVVFVVVSAAGGVVILVPALLLTVAPASVAPRLTTVSP